MPIYQYTCPKCNFSSEIVKPMSEIDRPEYCPKCSARRDRIMPRSDLRPFTPYLSDNLSPFSDRPVLVESTAHRKRLEKEAGVVPWWPGQGKKGCWV